MLKPLFAAAAIALLVPQLAAEARADNWFDFGIFRPHRPRVYYPGPDYMPAGPDPYADAYDPYGGPAFDESYYDPTLDRRPIARPLPASKPVKKKTVKKQPAAPAKQVAATGTAVVKPGSIAAPAAVPSAPVIAPDKSKPAAQPAKSSGGALSCDKAEQLVAGYGFANVKPASCSGATYAFNAVRDGKSYAVKLDSGSGELTEVKKIQ